MPRRATRPDPLTALSQRGGVPAGAPNLNERIASAIRAGIEIGEHPVGSLLPSENVLCTTYQASRFTVREALRKLTELGLIQTRRGAGSLVVSCVTGSGYSQHFKDLSEVLQYARNTRFDVFDIKPVQVDEDEAAYVAADRGSVWLRVHGLRRAISSEDPICYVKVLIHPRFAPILQDLRTAEGPIYAMIEARTGETIGEAVQSISAIGLPAAAAKALGRPAGSPAMKFVRRYCDLAGNTMLTSVNWHPGERFSYTMRIQRGEWR